ncbi:MAG: DNA repair protein RadA [Peptococcia bacterium]
MAKQKSKYVCQQCGFEALRWMGRCPDCSTWNSLVEEIERPRKTNIRSSESKMTRPSSLAEVEPLALERLDLGLAELNRVLGGGLVPGTLVLLAGDPGIGKSTLLLQAASLAARKLEKVLYITGEESAQQIKLRAERIAAGKDILIWAETDMEIIEEEIIESCPSLVIVDSIQTMASGAVESAPGSVSQVRECTGKLMNLAKEYNIPIIIVGHVTKDGSIAGPRVLEHMVDTVLYFEGERHYQYRILRSMKNRFGSTFEMGVFEMGSEGMVEVSNPSQAFLAERPEAAPGSVVAACMEGTRPLLIEIQALVSTSNFGQPRRMTAGTDFNRVNLIMAVLEKRVGLRMSNQDAYVNIAGGIKIQEPAMDLGIAISLASSLKGRSCAPNLVVVGEIGLTGEVRRVPYVQKRILEVKKLGFNHCLIPKNSFEGEKIEGIELLEVKTIAEALELALL